MTVLVTGAAGFIGFHVASRLLELGEVVIGVDGFTPYYDVQLKRDRAALLQKYDEFSMIEINLEDAEGLVKVVQQYRPEVVLHLAAQAGVRYSIDNPSAYISSNLVGTANLLEALRAYPPKHLLFASTSSVYGGNPWSPFAETSRTDYPVSLYAATKRGAESMTHSYAHLFGIPTTCFRFFTVYGPWGRPDMALFKFVDRMKRGDPIHVYGGGDMRRDFTYIDDLVDSVLTLSQRIPVAGEAVSEHDTISPIADWRVVNIAGGRSIALLDFISAIENGLGISARREYLPMQPGDVQNTRADSALLEDLIGSSPQTDLVTGIGEFLRWHNEYYRPSDEQPIVSK